MWFHIRVIKSISRKEYSIDTIINFSTQEDLTAFLDTHKVLAISTNSYDQEPEHFGDTYGSIQVDDQRHDFVTQESIVDTVSVMTLLWWEVVAVNSYNTPLDNSESIATIKQIGQDIDRQLAQDKQDTTRNRNTTKKSDSDTLLDDMQSSVAKALQDADYALHTYTDDPDALGKIQDSIQSLKKMRLSKNTEKIEAIIYQLYQYIDDVEQTYIAKLPDEPIDRGSDVSIPYFVRVYDRRRRAKKLQTITTHTHIGQKFYARWWQYIVFMQFLMIDIYQSFVAWRTQAKKVTHYAVVLILSTIVVVTITGLFISIFGQKNLDNILALQLFRIGMLGLALWLWYMISKKTLRHTSTILLISIAIFVCLHYLSKRFLILH